MKNEELITTSQLLVQRSLSVFEGSSNAIEYTGHEGSEATRLYIWKKSINIILQESVFSGTGFGGVYLILPGFGSSHSQYVDQFVRAGLVGFVFYLYFCFRILYYFRRDTAIVSGFVAFLVFGLFHETIKLTYGAFLFYILLNKTYYRG